MSALLEIEMIVIGVRGNRDLAKLQSRVSFLCCLVWIYLFL